MKLAFSTLGCPLWDFATAVNRARDYGYDAIDIRTLRDTNRVYDLEDFTTDLPESVALIEHSGIEISCFSSSVKAFTQSSRLVEFRQELTRYLELCLTFGTRYIRIFGGDIGETPREAAIEMVIENCRRYVEQAAPYGVTLLFETHDSWTDSAHVARIMDTVGSEYLAVLWDIAHPYRYSGEEPSETWGRLGSRIANTHWKDSRPADPSPDVPRDFRLCLLGEGTLPLEDFKRVLVEGGYDGYYTLEWEKKWHPYLEEPEVAFPHYISYMKGQ